MKVAIVEVGTLQALLETERRGSTFDSMMERELVRLRNSHLMLMTTQFFALILRDYAKSCLIAWVMFDSLVFFFAYFVSTHELCSQYSTMYGKVLCKLPGNCIRPSSFGLSS